MFSPGLLVDLIRCSDISDFNCRGKEKQGVFGSKGREDFYCHQSSWQLRWSMFGSATKTQMRYSKCHRALRSTAGKCSIRSHMSPPKALTVVNDTTGFSEMSKATRAFTAGVLNHTSGVFQCDKPGHIIFKIQILIYTRGRSVNRLPLTLLVTLAIFLVWRH